MWAGNFGLYPSENYAIILEKGGIGMEKTLELYSDADMAELKKKLKTLKNKSIK